MKYLSELYDDYNNEEDFKQMVKDVLLPEVYEVNINYDGTEDAGIGNSRVYIHWRAKDYYSSMFLSELPGQCGVLVAHSLPNIKYACTGIIRTDLEAIAIAEEVARRFDYAMVMISHLSNSGTLRTWKEHGYEEVSSAYNKHSGNNITICTKRM